MTSPLEHPELFDLRMSDAARPLFDRVVAFLEEVVAPMQAEFFALEGNITMTGAAGNTLAVTHGLGESGVRARLWCVPEIMVLTVETLQR